MPIAFDLQGHRGARGLKPENTLPSFEVALDCGVTSIETDLHRSRDGVPVLCHDPLLVDGNAVARLDLTTLRTYRFDQNPNPKLFPNQEASVTPLAEWYAAQHSLHPYALPTLTDLFQFVAAYAGDAGMAVGKTDEQRRRAGQLQFDLELKRVPCNPELIGDSYTSAGPAELEASVVAAIRTAGVADRTTVRSFDHRCVRYIRALEPALTGVVLVADTAFVDPGELARRADAHIYGPSWEFVDAEQVRAAHRAGVRVLPWTANTPEQWRHLLACEVDGITTDYPDRLGNYLREVGRTF